MAAVVYLSEFNLLCSKSAAADVGGNGELCGVLAVLARRQ